MRIRWMLLNVLRCTICGLVAYLDDNQTSIVVEAKQCLQESASSCSAWHLSHDMNH